MSPENVILEIIKLNLDTIDASIKVSNTVDRMKKELIEKLKIDLLAKFEQTVYVFALSLTVQILIIQFEVLSLSQQTYCQRSITFNLKIGRARVKHG